MSTRSMVQTPGATALWAGGAAGVVGLGVFLVVHAIWITPIWDVAVLGVVVAALGGMAVGWAYDLHRQRLPRNPAARIVVVTLAAAITVSPSYPVALVVGPPDPHALMVGRTPATAAMVIGGILFLIFAAAIGAAAGATVGGTRRAAGITALAGFSLAAGIGHNAPVIAGGTPLIKLWAIMLVTIAAAAVVLVTVDAGVGPPVDRE